MKKAIWTLNIDHYAPELIAITYPFFKQFARKIGAEFNIITERKFPENDIEYEKLQLHELGRDYDWNWYIDGDALIHPDMFDPTNHLSKDTVAHNGLDFAAHRWRYDRYFRRDGRNLASCNWLAIGSNWCLDLWRPPNDLTEEQAINNIFPLNLEKLAHIKAKHLVSDYILSRNIARFGLKCTSLIEMQKQLGREHDVYFWHEYLVPEEKKLSTLRRVLDEWHLTVPKD